MRVLALRHTSTVLGVFGEDVALEYHHLVEERRDRTCGAQSGDASAEDDGASAEGHAQIRSMIVTLAWPPPSHMVCRPYRPPVRSSSLSNVVIKRVPVAPIG